MSLSQYIKEKYERMKKERAESKGYHQILKKKAKLIDRQAYAKEYEKQARLKAVRDAKEKFSTKKPSGVKWSNVADNISGAFSSQGSAFPKHQNSSMGLFGHSVPKPVKGYKHPPAWDVTAGIFDKPKVTHKKRRKGKKRK